MAVSPASRDLAYAEAQEPAADPTTEVEAMTMTVNPDSIWAKLQAHARHMSSSDQPSTTGRFSAASLEASGCKHPFDALADPA